MRAEHLLFALVSLASCSMDSGPKQPDSSTTAANPPIAPPAAASSPEKTVREYLNWYAKHHTQLPANFIENIDGQDTTKYYAVDFRVTDSWLVAVHKSNVLSEAYLQHWRSYFKQYADTLRLHQQNDGPPSGFEYDFLMLSQEADTKVAELQAGTFTTKLASGAGATVSALGPQHEGWREGLNFKLTKSATGKWLIDVISIPADLTQ